MSGLLANTGLTVGVIHTAPKPDEILASTRADALHQIAKLKSKSWRGRSVTLK